MNKTKPKSKMHTKTPKHQDEEFSCSDYLPIVYGVIGAAILVAAAIILHPKPLDKGKGEMSPPEASTAVTEDAKLSAFEADCAEITALGQNLDEELSLECEKKDQVNDKKATSNV